MKKFDLTGISIKHIIYFITVVNLENMTKASRHLNVTQPLLSQKIMYLENEIGVQLFVREKRRLRLTSAGFLLYQEWVYLIQMLEQSIEKAKESQSEEIMHIKIGFSSGTNAQLIQEILTSLRYELPEFIVSIKIINLFKLRTKLLDETLDIIIFPDYDVNYINPKIKSTVIAYFPLLVTMHRSNPLASKEIISWEDLKSEKFLITRPSPSGDYENAISEACATCGFTPNIVYCGEDADMSTVFMGVVMGDGILVTLVPGLDNGNLITYVMEGRKYPVSIAWKAKAKPPVADFELKAVELIRQIYLQKYGLQ